MAPKQQKGAPSCRRAPLFVAVRRTNPMRFQGVLYPPRKKHRLEGTGESIQGGLVSTKRANLVLGHLLARETRERPGLRPHAGAGDDQNVIPVPYFLANSIAFLKPGAEAAITFSSTQKASRMYPGRPKPRPGTARIFCSASSLQNSTSSIGVCGNR